MGQPGTVNLVKPGVNILLSRTIKPIAISRPLNADDIAITFGTV